MKIIGSTKNPFINIAINVANNKEDFDKSSFQLIDFLIEYGHDKNFDLNEQFLAQNNESYSSSNKYRTNFFNTFFILNNSYNPQLINRLVESGLKINPFLTDENNETIGDILFTRTELDERRNIFLFNLYLKQYGIEDFTEKLKSFNTLNNCISQNKLELAKFLLQHVSIDLTNKDLQTPIMFARNLETLNFLSKYNPNWGVKDVLGHDCSYFFSGMGDDNMKKEMIKFYFQELSKDSRSIEENPDYIKGRLEETLINLVTKDSTKVELQTFLKKYKLKDFESLTNKEDRTLGHVCVNKEDFARFDLFPKIDMYHVDKNGYNIFSTLFSKNRFSSITKNKKAKEILLRCLEQPEKNITQPVFNRLLSIPFSSHHTNPLPDWILQNHFLRNETLKVLKISGSDINFGNYINNYNSFSSTDKNKLFFNLMSNLIKEFEVPLLTESETYNKIFDTYNYSGCRHSFNQNNAEIIFLLLEKCNDLNKINMVEFLENNFSNINTKLFELKNSFMVYNPESYENKEELDKENHENFYKEVCMPFFKFITDYKLLSLMNKIDEDLINQTLKIDTKGELNEFLKTFSFLKLNKKLIPKNVTHKNIKI